MARISSVKRSSVFSRAYKFGECVVTRRMAVYVLKRKKIGNGAPSCLGITVSKKYGKAVARSRARRIIREAYRALMPFVLPGRDIIVVARHSLDGAKTADALEDLEYALFKACALARDGGSE